MNQRNSISIYFLIQLCVFSAGGRIPAVTTSERWLRLLLNDLHRTKPLFFFAVVAFDKMIYEYLHRGAGGEALPVARAK